MESSFQKIIAAIVSVMILFIIPVYIAFEKVDDISYSLAVKLTQNFVDNARSKGYISPEMYSDFVSGLYSTNTAYDVTIEHVKKRYDPVIYIYEKDGEKKGKLLHTLDYEKYKQQFEEEKKVKVKIDTDGNEIVYSSDNSYIEKAHKINQEVITDKQIVAQMFKNTGITKVEFLRQCSLGNINMYKSLAYMNENSYLMHEGDNVNVIVKNRSQTIASVFYSMFTANVGSEDIAKIYVNYGGTVKNDGETILTTESGSVSGDMGRIFRYTGTVQEVTLLPGKYSIECWGASGGYGKINYAGKGAYSSAEYEIQEETTLYVYVGEKGSLYSESNQNNGGYNGGGNAYNAYGGGGASDVRLLRGEPDDTASLLTRIIVAAGGGGSSKEATGQRYGSGGYGGTFAGSLGGYKLPLGANNIYTILNGATSWYGSIQTSNLGAGIGADDDRISVGYTHYKDENTGFTMSIPVEERGNLGVGGSVDFDGAGAGGGGYFGGSAAHHEYAGGGGGLSYVYVNDSYRITSVITHPLKKFVYNNYRASGEIEIIDEYIENGRWKGIKYIEGTRRTIAGNTSMPNPLTFGGASTMSGNTGNGYVVIKKTGDL